MEYTVAHENGVVLSVEAVISMSDLEGHLTAVPQMYSISFVDSSAGAGSVRFSGNPGYIVGEPVVAGERSGNDITLNEDRFQYLTLVRPNADGTCGTDANSPRLPVLFGENVRSGCLLEITDDVVQNGCDILRNHTLEALLGPGEAINSRISIASFGNAVNLTSSDWIPLLYNSPSSGCKKLSMHLEILYSYVGALNNPQAMIIGAKLHWIEEDFSTLCLGPICLSSNAAVIRNMEVASSVAFIDVSPAPQAVYAERPVSSNKLPADFFRPYYPPSGAHKPSSSSILLSMTIIALLCVF